MSHAKPRHNVSLRIDLVQHAYLVTFFPIVVLFDTKVVKPDESWAIGQSQMAERVVRILRYTKAARTAANAAKASLITAHIRNRHKQRLPAGRELIKRCLEYFAM